MKITLATSAMFVGVLALSAGAQEVKDRKEDQQGRIGEGVQSGQLTPGETNRLETREKHINRETRRDRAKNGGTLTPGEKAKVNAQQNKVSKSIYRDKHNEAAQ